MHIKTLAQALGISRRQVHVLRNKGMPVHDLQAAIEWRSKNLRSNMVKGVRADGNPGR